MAPELSKVDWPAWRTQKRNELEELGVCKQTVIQEVSRAEERTQARLLWLNGLFQRRQYAVEAADAELAVVEQGCQPAYADEGDDPMVYPKQRALAEIDAELDAIRLRDRWPRELHFHAI